MKIVAAAIIVREGRIFIARRPKGKSLAHHWEFPGGKQEPNETLPECLKRELREELGIEAQIGDFFMKSTFCYDFDSIELHCYFATVAPSTDVISNEHEQTAWVAPHELCNYNFAPADIPIIERLADIKLNR